MRTAVGRQVACHVCITAQMFSRFKFQGSTSIYCFRRRAAKTSPATAAASSANVPGSGTGATLTTAPLPTTPVADAVGNNSVIAVAVPSELTTDDAPLPTTLSLGVIDASSVSLIAPLPLAEPVNAPPGTKLPPVIVRSPVPNAAPESSTSVPPLIVVPPVYLPLADGPNVVVPDAMSRANRLPSALSVKIPLNAAALPVGKVSVDNFPPLPVTTWAA